MSLVPPEKAQSDCLGYAAGFVVTIPGEFCAPLSWSRKETVMKHLIQVALVAVVLVCAGCSSMGMNTTTSAAPGDMSQPDSSYGGGRL